MDKPYVPTLALLVQAEEQYGVRQVIARVMAVQADGSLHNVKWDYSGDVGKEFYGMEVSAYLGDTSMGSTSDTGDTCRIWGHSIDYKPFSVSKAEQARDMARVMTRIEKHLQKATADEGYISEADFHLYLLRVAAAIKVKTLYVRNLRRAEQRTGEMFRKTDGAGLQSYIRSVADHAHKGELAEIGIRR
jgi:hypothetical protein